MNVTREPIILSVITPKEGCKLVLRNSNIDRQEDNFVDAVEVISFDKLASRNLLNEADRFSFINKKTANKFFYREKKKQIKKKELTKKEVSH